MLRWCLYGCCFMSVTYVTSGLLDHLPQLGREISGGVIKNNPNQRMTDTTTPKPTDGRKTLSPLTNPLPFTLTAHSWFRSHGEGFVVG